MSDGYVCCPSCDGTGRSGPVIVCGRDDEGIIDDAPCPVCWGQGMVDAGYELRRKVGDYLAARRREARRSLREEAQRWGISRHELSEIERGQYRGLIPSVELARWVDDITRSMCAGLRDATIARAFDRPYRPEESS